MSPCRCLVCRLRSRSSLSNSSTCSLGFLGWISVSQPCVSGYEVQASSEASLRQEIRVDLTASGRRFMGGLLLPVCLSIVPCCTAFQYGCFWCGQPSCHVQCPLVCLSLYTLIFQLILLGRMYILRCLPALRLFVILPFLVDFGYLFGCVSKLLIAKYMIYYIRCSLALPGFSFHCFFPLGLGAYAIL